MTIDQFIDIVSGKLANKVVKHYEWMRGSDLKLTGYKEVRGKPIEDHIFYKIPVPVEIKIDHKKKLQMAWITKGRAGVRAYVSRYIPKGKEESLELVMLQLDQRKGY
jgi:hypothetical protein